MMTGCSKKESATKVWSRFANPVTSWHIINGQNALIDGFIDQEISGFDQ